MKKLVFLISITILSTSTAVADTSADAIVKAAFDYWRGKASVSVTEMTIHRPDWERKMTIKAWTKGESDSLFIITAPAKDKGNGTLKVGKGMWMYNPKVNRVIKLPPSMMSQAWQGSDFSNNDLAKTDSLIKDYTHTIEKTDTRDGNKVFMIKSMPKPDAPVVWGMIKLIIREDHILLSEEFFDEELEPVKIMSASDIQMTGDRLFPMSWKMQKSDVADEYTLMVYKEITFLNHLDKNIFSLTNLKNPGR